jgi:small subunit ribosomal protein S8
MDPISDLLTRIRNAIMVKHQELLVPHSNFIFAILSVLQKEGYINFCKIIEKDKNKSKTGKKKEIKISLKYDKNEEPVIHKLKKVSKSGQRIYSSKKNLPKVLQGLGIAIVSTSRGIMTDREARKRNLGGEVVCEVW